MVHAFFYKKVVYKKVYIKWPKIKKVLIYNIQDPKKFHKKVHKKGLYMDPGAVKEVSLWENSFSKKNESLTK